VLHLLVACDRLEAIERLVAERSSPLVAQAVVLGTELPGGVELSAEDGWYASAAQVFLADVSDPSQLAEAPVSGASVVLRAGSRGHALAEVDEDGKYRVTDAEGFAYEPGTEIEVAAHVGEATGTLAIELPGAPEARVPATHRGLEPMPVSIEDDAAVQVLAATYLLDRGTLTWDNLPDDVAATYEFTHPEAPVHAVEIPAEAFKYQGTYAVGVAGMHVADADAVAGMNTTLSSLVAGRFGVSIVPVSAPELDP
jgi:hypothetical protein